MLTMACVAQAVSLRGAMTPRRAQPAGLALLIVTVTAVSTGLLADATSLFAAVATGATIAVLAAGAIAWALRPG